MTEITAYSMLDLLFKLQRKYVAPLITLAYLALFFFLVNFIGLRVFFFFLIISHSVFIHPVPFAWRKESKAFFCPFFPFPFLFQCSLCFFFATRKYTHYYVHTIALHWSLFSASIASICFDVAYLT